MVKSVITAVVLLFSFGLQAEGNQYETVAERANGQEQYLYSSLATKTSADNVAKLKKEVDNHVDIYFAEDSGEFKARLALKRIAFLKKKLSKYFSEAEIADLRLQLSLIAAFGDDAKVLD